MSTTLYRSPNVVIDAHEWHVLVCKCRGRSLLQYRWRPLSLREFRWLPITSWVGPKPKRIGNVLRIFKPHVERAMRSEAVRRERVAALRSRSAAVVANVGTLEQVA
jgi:hypothetical protein